MQQGPTYTIPYGLPEFEDWKLHHLITPQPQPAETGSMCTLIGKVKINGRTHRINVLLDSGADMPYVNDRLRIKLGIPILEDSPVGIVQLADGSRSNVDGNAGIPLQLGDYEETIEARVVDLADFDMILGLTWLQSANPSIDWQKMTATVADQTGQSYALPLGRPYNLINVLQTPAAKDEFLHLGWDSKSTKKLVNQESSADLEDAYLCVIRRVQDPATNREQKKGIRHLAAKVSRKLRQILYKFASCFRDELPEELPSKRDIEHPIAGSAIIHDFAYRYVLVPGS